MVITILQSPRAHSCTRATHHTLRSSNPPIVPKKAETSDEHADSGSSGNGGGGKGGKSKKSAPGNVFLAGLTALVVATPLVGLSVKAKVDPQGFKDTLLDSLPAPIAKVLVTQFLQDVPPKILDQKPAPSQTTKFASPTMDAAAVVMALPPSLAGVGARVFGCICVHF